MSPSRITCTVLIVSAAASPLSESPKAFTPSTIPVPTASALSAAALERSPEKNCFAAAISSALEVVAASAPPPPPPQPAAMSRAAPDRATLKHLS